MIQPVILSGGSGTRLWPLSREEYPKHLIPLVDQHSLLQETWRRLRGLPGLKKPIVICNAKQRFMVAAQLQAIHCAPAAIILEPVGRNTAPAVALAALQAQTEDPLLLVLAADHMIKEPEAFCAVVRAAIPLAEAGNLVTFGVVPTHPHTGYGYIQQGKALSKEAYQVAQFVEKPTLATAEHYVQSKQYLWNSGMFLFRASTYLSALKKHAPDILTACQNALQKQIKDLDFTRLDEASFKTCPDISIDYAVMEKADNTVVLPLAAGWSDVGSWESLADIGEKDKAGNVCQGDILTDAAQNNYLRAESRLLVALGVNNMVVVETPDAVLVADKRHSQHVKKIVDQLKAQHRHERLHHLTHYRPWGQHTLLVNGTGFQVRRVCVNPGKMISLQKHQLRSEHWVVVQGQASVECEGKPYTISENKSFYVEKNCLHSIKNTGATVLEFIEVQVGHCLKEDDVERLN